MDPGNCDGYTVELLPRFLSPRKASFGLLSLFLLFSTAHTTRLLRWSCGSWGVCRAERGGVGAGPGERRRVDHARWPHRAALSLLTPILIPSSV
eukprot:1968476-Rhodomonas_salina.1